MRRAFAKILRILLAAATVFAGSILEGTAKKEVLRLDASSEEKMQQSFFKMLMALDDTDQQKFSSAMAIIGVMMQQRDGETKFGKLKDILDGKTADEIIATARRMTPYIKQHSKILDGSTPEKFGKSISLVMISLPEDLQPAFSEAIAKLMFDAKQNKEDKKKMDEIKKLLEALMERLDETNACKSRIEQNEAELANGRATIEKLTAARDAVLAERDEAWKKIEVMHEEIEMLQEAIAKAEVERKLGEYNAAMQTYSDEEKKVVSEEMAKFEADPVGCGIEVNQITEKIEAAAYRKMKEQHKVEVNAAMRVSFDDVFAPIETPSIASDNYDDMFVE